jgi:cyclophilin family peptidyl-prolyl cis-trans isomerase
MPTTFYSALDSPDPETRAQTVAGIAKHHAADAMYAQLDGALEDPDWRVAVEAARALASGTGDRNWFAMSLAGKSPHVVHEALRGRIGKPLQAGFMPTLLAAPGWTGCLAARVADGPNVVDAVSKCALPDHLKLPLLADVTDPAAKRAALRILLAHDDPRVRSAGLALLATTWPDADPRTRQTIVTTLTSAIAANDPIIASSAIDAISTILDGGPDDTLASAIVARAATETDVDLSTELFGVIEKHALTAGLDACKRGLAGAPARAKAAAACVTALGEAATARPDRPTEPPVDVATVIGHRVTWQLTTNKGAITIELRPDVAPWAVASIAALTRKHFYDGLELHRVVPDFVVQGGDPTESGMGGPGYSLPAEPSGAADGPGFITGGVGMADSGPDSAGSQWFIMHSRAPHLDGRYTWVGSVIAGQAVADALVIGDKVETATVEIR